MAGFAELFSNLQDDPILDHCERAVAAALMTRLGLEPTEKEAGLLDEDHPLFCTLGEENGEKQLVVGGSDWKWSGILRRFDPSASTKKITTLLRLYRAHREQDNSVLVIIGTHKRGLTFGSTQTDGTQFYDFTDSDKARETSIVFDCGNALDDMVRRIAKAVFATKRDREICRRLGMD